jgi:hypothetical protein
MHRPNRYPTAPFGESAGSRRRKRGNSLNGAHRERNQLEPERIATAFIDRIPCSRACCDPASGPKGCAQSPHSATHDFRIKRRLAVAAAEGFRLTMNSFGGTRPLETGEPRSERDALIRELSRHIAQARTATAALLAWCDEHRLSQGPIIAKRLERDRTVPAGDVSLPEIGVLPEELLCRRRVQLVRGDLPLVTADNWFLPARLPARMNDVLESTDLPFGAVVAPLNPARRNASIHFSDPGDGESWGPETILEHRAIVFDGEGQPLAVVRERFRVELVSFPSYPTTMIR